MNERAVLDEESNRERVRALVTVQFHNLLQSVRRIAGTVRRKLIKERAEAEARHHRVSIDLMRRSSTRVPVLQTVEGAVARGGTEGEQEEEVEKPVTEQDVGEDEESVQGRETTEKKNKNMVKNKKNKTTTRRSQHHKDVSSFQKAMDEAAKNLFADAEQQAMALRARRAEKARKDVEAFRRELSGNFRLARRASQGVTSLDGGRGEAGGGGEEGAGGTAEPETGDAGPEQNPASLLVETEALDYLEREFTADIDNFPGGAEAIMDTILHLFKLVPCMRPFSHKKQLKLVATLKRREFLPGECLVAMGDDVSFARACSPLFCLYLLTFFTPAQALTFFTLLEGQISVKIPSEDGQALVEVVRRDAGTDNSYFGDMALTGEKAEMTTRSASIFATVKTVCAELHRDDFFRLLEEIRAEYLGEAGGAAERAEVDDEEHKGLGDGGVGFEFCRRVLSISCPPVARQTKNHLRRTSKTNTPGSGQRRSCKSCSRSSSRRTTSNDGK